MGFLKRLLRIGENRPPAIESSDAMCEIVGDYGTALEKKAMTPAYVADERRLPHPKEQIKRAIIYALKINLLPQLQEHLKGGYIELAMWQKGVGQEDQLWGLDVLSMNPKNPVQTLARQLSDQSPDPKWAKLILDERAQLKQELDDLGLWQDTPASVKR
jgi:hypothetical protein